MHSALSVVHSALNSKLLLPLPLPLLLQALDERRLKLTLGMTGHVMEVLSDTPASLFGTDPTRLLGRHVSAFLDIFRPGVLHSFVPVSRCLRARAWRRQWCLCGDSVCCWAQVASV
jgi:hypothetical protein